MIDRIHTMLTGLADGPFVVAMAFIVVLILGWVSWWEKRP